MAIDRGGAGAHLRASRSNGWGRGLAWRIGIVALGVMLLAFGVVHATADHKALVIGKVDAPSESPPASIVIPKPDIGRPPVAEPRPARGLLSANGSAYGRALAFHSTIPIKPGLRFILVAGSDARPGQDLHHTRSDSLHLVAIDPATRQGTIVGIPRDSYVSVPGHGEQKINTAIELGGPELMVQTMRDLTGLPIEYYVLTGFQGFSEMVDELNGVDVFVARRMNDDYSGAHFEPGYHHFNGEQALAFCRDRHDVPYSDFSRSENQGTLLLAALSKLRAEVDDDAGLRHWMSVLAAHAEFDVPTSELDGLAALARRLDPARLTNIVVPGKVGTASGGQSVVYLGEDAARIFGDMRDDARLSTASEAPPEQPEDTTTTTEETTTTSTSTTSTTSGGIFGGGGGSTTTTSTTSP